VQSQQPSQILPTQPSKRIQTIDILRGFAIFGILLVNMELFNRSFVTVAAGIGEPVALLDRFARGLITFLAEGKFYSTFAFLFGLGMAILHHRVEERGGRFVPLYLRRMLVLLVIGLVHAYLFWVGDILILYALLGVVLLLLFRNRRPKTLLIWIFIFLLAPLLLNGALLALVEFGKMAPDGEQMMAEIFDQQALSLQTRADEANAVYAAGSFAEVTGQRIRDMSFVYSTWPFMAFNVLAMFVLGLYAGKRRILYDIADNRPLIGKVLLSGLVIGVIGNLVYVILGSSTSRMVPSPELLLALAGQTFGAPAFSLFYMAGLTLLLQNPAWQKRLAPLSYVGRMALTNYLLQTVICTTLFYGYGFGLYGRVGPATGLLLAVTIYAIQIPLSAWWLKRYRFGPAEWLWRSLTYGRRQPMLLPDRLAPQL
jgi:uncharacterized protein